MNKSFNRGWKEGDKKDGLLKRLKNIEVKNEEQSKAIENQGRKQLDEIRNISSDSKPLQEINYFGELNSGAKKLYNQIKKEKSNLNSEKLACVQNDGIIHKFNVFKNSLDFASDIQWQKFIKRHRKKPTQNVYIIDKSKSEI